MKNRFEAYNRVSMFSEITEEYCYHAKPNDYIEVTEWHNGEGFDVDICTTRRNQNISLTYGEWKLFKKLVKALDKREISDYSNDNKDTR